MWAWAKPAVVIGHTMVIQTSIWKVQGRLRQVRHPFGRAVWADDERFVPVWTPGSTERHRPAVTNFALLSDLFAPKAFEEPSRALAW